MIIEANMARSSDKSHMIIEIRKRKRLEELFKLLDSDCDGLISSSKIEISEVPTEILEIYAPLLCEMEEMGHTLTLEDFIDGSERLLQILTVPQKNIILFNKKSTSSNATPHGCTFQVKIHYRHHTYRSLQPKLDKNSMKLASKKRQQTEGSLYDRAIENRKVFL